MPQWLFAYGTLQPSLAPEAIRVLMAPARLMGRGRTAGRLYDLGEYPAAVFDESAPSFVCGSVLELRNDWQHWNTLDEYEGVDLVEPQSGLYTRVIRPVRLDDGGLLDCCAYAYNRRVDVDRLIVDGIYRAPNTPRT